MKKILFFITLLLIIGFSFQSCNTDYGAEIEPPDELGFKDSTFAHPKDIPLRLLLVRYVREKELPGVGLLIHDKNGLWLDARGHARLEDRTQLKGNHLFMANELTSTLTAVLVLQAVESGKIRLSDSITKHLDSKYLENIANAESIMVSHLLAHSSGIPDFQQTKQWLLDTANDYEREYDPEKFLDYLRHAKSAFAPSQGVQYSATNYLLLSLILDRLSEGSHTKLMQEQIFGKVGMAKSYYKSGENYPHLKGTINFYWDKRSNKILENITKISLKQMSYKQGEDGVITNLYDLFLFSQALQNNRLFQSQMPLQIMQTWVGTSDSTAYGAGLERRKTPYGIAIGNRGLGYGGTTYWYYLPDSGTTVIFTTNIGTRTAKWADQTVEEFWQDVLKILQ